jgi:hypothetical protein
VQRALNTRSFNRNLRNANMLRNPGARTRLVAGAATAGWGGRHGWWRHGHGGYGWVGPVFWPFAFYDLSDYAFWGYGYDPSFWDYGYGDIYAGLFAPYGYDAMVGYLPSRRSGGTAPASAAPGSNNVAADDSAIAPMCGDDSRDVAGVPVDKIQQSLQLSDDQRGALDALANASVQAAQGIRTACPTSAPLTAPARLAVMEQRVQAMITAVQTVQPPLDKFYGMLNDDQKAKLNGLAQDQSRAKQADRLDSDQNCGIASMSNSLAWPTDEITQRLQPNDQQKAKLAALQDATFKAADSLKSSCRPSNALTPPARLAAAGQRLDAILQAVKAVRAPLEDFYGSLSDEQKAQFEAIGPDRGQKDSNASLNDDDSQQAAPAARSGGHRRHTRVGVHGVERAVRRLISIIP